MTYIEDVVDLQNPRNVSISPDSQLVVYETGFCWDHKAGEHLVTTIWLAHVGRAHSAWQITSGKAHDQKPKWAPDGQSVIFLSDRAKPGKSCALYSLAAKKEAEPVALTDESNERPIEKFAFSPDGKSIAYVSADEKTADQKAREEAKDDVIVWGEDRLYGRLRLFDLESKKVDTLLSSETHVVDFAWAPDGKKIAFATGKTPDEEDWFIHGCDQSLLDLETKNTEALAHFGGPVQHLTHVGDSLYLIGAATPGQESSSQMVYKLNLKESELSVKPHAHGQEDCGWELRQTGSDVTLRVIHGLEDQIRILDGRTLFSRKQAINAWDAAFTQDSDEIVLAVAISDTNTPYELYTTTASGGALIQVSNHGEKLAGQKLGVCTPVFCETTDGEDQIEGLFLTPVSKAKDDGTPSEELPTVVLIHGGPYYPANEAFDGVVLCHWNNVLLRAGYSILIPFYRGGASHGEAFAAKAREGPSVYDYPDVIAMTNHVVEKGWADRNRLIVGGLSMGGFLTYLACVRNGMHGFGWKYKAAIAECGITDWDTMCLTSDQGTVNGQLTGQLPWTTLDKSNVKGRGGSALWEFRKGAEEGVIPPILMLHGEKDLRCPLEQAVAFRRALDTYNLPSEFVVYPGEGHMHSERRHWIDMLERIEAFVKKHI